MPSQDGHCVTRPRTLLQVYVVPVCDRRPRCRIVLRDVHPAGGQTKLGSAGSRPHGRWSGRTDGTGPRSILALLWYALVLAIAYLAEIARRYRLQLVPAAMWIVLCVEYGRLISKVGRRPRPA